MGNLCQKVNNNPPRSPGNSGGISTGDVDIGELDGPLSKAEYNERVVSCPMTRLKLKSVTMSYSFFSQRGYYPDDLSKANQDSYFVNAPFNGDEDFAFFAVLDGHGAKGHLCAQFARDAVQANLKQLLDAGTEFDVAYPRSFILANEQLHKSRIDDTMSGTTCIGMCIKDGWLEIANCGDSRAIIACEEDTGRKKSTKLIARPLSIDQTPFRKDERERVKKSGARVMTMDQLDGLEPIHENWGLNLGEEIDDSGDPPRIWAQDGDYPGTAFTRSIGDSVSERLGVFADPEMGREQLTSQDKFIVVASDGVFEFLTSQAVVDMVCKYTDTLSASRAVVEESYQLWLQYEVRTDDITMICIFLESVANGSDAPRKSTAQGPTKEKQMRPVRANLSRAKRRSIVRGQEDETEEEYIIADHIVKKSKEEEQRIDAAVKTNFLFQNLGGKQREEVFSVMAKENPKVGDVIMKQGEAGDKFYVVDSGKYEVRISSTVPVGSDLGDVVHKYGEGGHFGELALMYAKPRAASIICTQAGVLWSLDRAAFRAILMRSDASSLKKTLRKVDVLKGLTYTQVERLIETMSERTFRDGEVIIKQGDMGDTFYIVTEGAGVCTIKTDGTEKEVLQLQQYDYFGERALLSDAPRAASVKAIGKRVKCLHIAREAFEDVLGPLERIIDQDRRRREKAASLHQSNVASNFSAVNGSAAATALTGTKITDLQMTGSVTISEDHGAFSCFTIVKLASGPEEYGLKTIGKNQSIENKMATAISNERWLWSTLKEKDLPTAVIPKILATCCDINSLHVLCSPPIGGGFTQVVESFFGDLKAAGDREAHAKFYIGCALVALEFLHKEDTLYRALAPEQLLVNTSGYLQLADFRFSKRLRTRQDKTYTLCGTPDYMSPEQVNSSGHGLPTDVWSLGVMLYELVSGDVPFGNGDDNDLTTFAAITGHNSGGIKQIEGGSAALMSVINAMVDPVASKRPDPKKLMSDPWFGGVSFSNLAAGKMEAPHTAPINAAGPALVIDDRYNESFESSDTAWYDGF